MPLFCELVHSLLPLKNRFYQYQKTHVDIILAFVYQVRNYLEILVLIKWHLNALHQIQETQGKLLEYLLEYTCFRSEERRVGKECRYRLLMYNNYIESYILS